MLQNLQIHPAKITHEEERTLCIRRLNFFRLTKCVLLADPCRRGTRLSVGQKQRIAIARALLRNPDVLILDEPTAPLDPVTETGLMRTLRAIAAERIVLLIAHRAETLAACDVVHFIDRGTVAGSAPHAKLLVSSAAYRNYLAISPSDSPAV